METILDNGIALIEYLQSLGAGLRSLMAAFTFLGNEEFYLLMLPLAYWCIDAVFGLRLGVMLLFTSSINAYFKLIFHLPRPYWYSPKVQSFVAESSFGAPSGHSQNAVALWGLAAATLRKKWAWIAAIGIMLMVGVSRMVLGVHFHLDVISGWLLGVLVLWLFLKFETPVTRWYLSQQTGRRIMTALIISLAIILVGWLIALPLAGWELPADWIARAELAHPDEPISPLTLSGLVTNAGVLFGMLSGAVLSQRSGGFSAGGPIWQRLLRYLLGVAILIGIWAGLDALFPEGETLLAMIFRYVRYTLVGGWVALGGPWMFIKLRLAKAAQ